MDKLETHVEHKPGKKLPKDITVAIIFLIATVIIAAVVFFFRPTYISSNENVPLEIAESYLNKQTTIEDYKISEVAIVLDNSAKFVSMSYSVKPTENHYDDWADSSGSQNENGWIIDKSTFISYINIGNIYFTGINANTDY